MSWEKNAYIHSPQWLQTIAVNSYSAWMYRNKYGRYFHQYLKQLEKNERKSSDQLLDEQAVAIKKLLRYAREHVPYYRDLGDLPDDLTAWPIISKQVVLQSPDKFCSDKFSKKKLLSDFTGGTTGTPLTVYFTKKRNQLEWAYRWRHKAWGGIPFLSRSAVIGGPRPVVPANQKKPSFGRIDYVEKRLILSVYHMSQENLPWFVDALAKYNPEFLHGFPSALFVLAKYMVEAGSDQIHPKAVFCGSETLFDYQRAIIEQAFNTKLFNWYGNTEFTCNIIECSHGELHHRTDYGVLELVDENTMVCTGFDNPAMPLIRYTVGDSVMAKSGVCGCGCSFPLIERIEGRIEDYIRTPDGRMIGRLDSILKGAEHIHEAQIVQQRLDEIILRIVRANGFCDRDEKSILTEAIQRLGDSVQVRFQYVDTIERSPRGKIRFVVSELDKQ